MFSRDINDADIFLVCDTTVGGLSAWQIEVAEPLLQTEVRRTRLGKLKLNRPLAWRKYSVSRDSDRSPYIRHSRPKSPNGDGNPPCARNAFAKKIGMLIILFQLPLDPFQNRYAFLNAYDSFMVRKYRRVKVIG